MASRKKEAVVLFLIASVTGLFYWRLVSWDKVACSHDLLAFFYPYKYFLGQSLQQGQIPLWNPYTYSGTPFMANLASGVFYPFNLLFCLWTFVPAMNLFFLLHCFLTGYFTYLFLRSLNLTRWSGFLGGVVVMGCGSFSSQLEWLGVIASWPWVPLCFFILEKALTSKRPRGIWVFLGLALSWQFLAGHPQVLFYNVLALFFYYLYHSVQIKKFSFWWLASLLAAGVVLIQLVPFVEFSRQTIRGAGISYEAAIQGSLDPRDLSALVNPWPALYGFATINSWQVSLYAGLVPCLLALLAVFLKAGRPKNFFALLLVASLFVALGVHNPLYKFLYDHFPPFQYVRQPVKILFLWHFSLAVLAAYGLDWIARRPGRYTLIAMVLILAVVIDLFYFSADLYATVPFTALQRSVTAPCLSQEPSRFFLTPKTQQSWFDLGLPSDEATLQKQADALFSNFSIYYGLWDADGFGSMRLKLLDEVLDKVKRQKNPSETRLLDLLAVKSIVTFWELKDPEFALLKLRAAEGPGGSRELKVYQRSSTAPMAWIADKAVWVKDYPEAWAAIQSPGFRPYEQVVLVGDLGGVSQVSGKKNNRLQVEEWGPQQIRLKAFCGSPCWVVASLPYTPGWRVWVDRQERRLFRVDYLLQGLFLEPGQHDLLISYRPKSYIWSGWASFLSLIFIGFAGVFWLKTRKAKQKTTR